MTRGKSTLAPNVVLNFTPELKKVARTVIPEFNKSQRFVPFLAILSLFLFKFHLFYQLCSFFFVRSFSIRRSHFYSNIDYFTTYL